MLEAQFGFDNRLRAGVQELQQRPPRPAPPPTDAPPDVASDPASIVQRKLYEENINGTLKRGLMHTTTRAASCNRPEGHAAGGTAP